MDMNNNMDLNHYNAETMTVSNPTTYHGTSALYMNVKVPVVVHTTGSEPTYQTKGAAGADLKIASDVVLAPNVPTMVSTGISIAIPEGYVGLLFIRSSLSTKGINLANSVGVIDSDYRGEVWLTLTNNSTTTITLNKGDRVAQLAIMSVQQFPFLSVDKLQYTVRGEGRFGSTGI